MRREEWEWALSAGPASVYHLCNEPVNFLKLTLRVGHEGLGGDGHSKDLGRHSKDLGGHCK